MRCESGGPRRCGRAKQTREMDEEDRGSPAARAAGAESIPPHEPEANPLLPSAPRGRASAASVKSTDDTLVQDRASRPDRRDAACSVDRASGQSRRPAPVGAAADGDDGEECVGEVETGGTAVAIDPAGGTGGNPSPAGAAPAAGGGNPAAAARPACPRHPRQ